MQDPFIYNIAEIGARLGIKDIILSPGSRCAPLTIAFNRHPEINIRVISDERSAAYIALGLALGTSTPVGLVCTSGTAAANYLPAVTEAFYQKIPLILFTADRPPEWINQQDNQAIQQVNLYGKHVKEFYQLPVDLSHQDAKWQMVRNISEAINLSREYPQGPVHINVPVREPFYPSKDEKITFDTDLRISRIEENHELNFILSEQLKEALSESRKILIIGGQQKYNEHLVPVLSSLTELEIPIVGDIVSNLHEVKNIIQHPDVFLPHYQRKDKNLKPDLLITFGDNILSKNLKLFLRQYKPVRHWHIQSGGKVADTFQSLTHIIRSRPENFFKFLKGFGDLSVSKEFNHHWQQAETTATEALKKYFKVNKKGELFSVYSLLKQIPENVNLHLANSMVVRYANLIGLPSLKGVKVYANRGTSGIDGSNSTAVGISLSDANKQNILLTGDMAFLYDRNAFWHNYPLKNLKIMVLNNSGGGIFRLIDGPSSLPELEEFFETKQRFNAELTAKEYSFKYIKISKSESNRKLSDFMENTGPAILEYFSDSKENQKEYKKFKEEIYNSFNK